MDLRINYTHLEARKFFFWLISIDFMFGLFYVVIHILEPGIHWGPFRQLFDLDVEVTIPNWFSSIQLFAISVMLFIASMNNQRKQQVSSSFLKAGSMLFIFLSADESAAIHEKITILARKLGINWLLFKGMHGAWVIIYSIVAIIGILLTARYFRKLWRYFRHETMIALIGAIVLVTGAVVFEIIGYLFLQSGSLSYKVEVVFEEVFEMSGASIIFYSVLLLYVNISTTSSTAVSGVKTEHRK